MVGNGRWFGEEGSGVCVVVVVVVEVEVEVEGVLSWGGEGMWGGWEKAWIGSLPS